MPISQIASYNTGLVLPLPLKIFSVSMDNTVGSARVFGTIITFLSQNSHVYVIEFSQLCFEEQIFRTELVANSRYGFFSYQDTNIDPREPMICIGYARYSATTLRFNTRVYGHPDRGIGIRGFWAT